MPNDTVHPLMSFSASISFRWNLHEKPISVTGYISLISVRDKLMCFKVRYVLSLMTMSS